MRAARMFMLRLEQAGRLQALARVQTELFGSLGATGKGHGSDLAVLLGLMGHEPDSVPPDDIQQLVSTARQQRSLDLLGWHRVAFDEARDLLFYALKRLPFHANGMRFTAYADGGVVLDSHTYYSVGGGFVVSEQVAENGVRQKMIAPDTTALPMPFGSGDELLALTASESWSVAQVMRLNERHWRSDVEIDAGLMKVWETMQACVKRGCESEGHLPGPYRVRRRAPGLYQKLTQMARQEAPLDPLHVLDWVNLYALAVNEENASGGRVVTAPTNGAAGIVPAVLHYYHRHVPGASDEGVREFLLTAGAIGILYKENASISGAEVGCQGEVGVACSMAAAALCAVLGGTPKQVENAAEIGMEHHLGLTCDPVGGLVQIPCIERNAIAAVKAINAARMALHGDGNHSVSLDKVIKTMRETGADMMSKYKETSRGGLAVNIVEC